MKGIDERIKLVKAMEYIARQVNDEEVFMYWLTMGVADGDIEYGDLTLPKDGPMCRDLDEASYYAQDDVTFSELMDAFLNLMEQAKTSGGLYCDGVVSKEG